MTSTLPGLAILDDYQRVALNIADWSPLKDKVQIDVFDDTIADEDKLVGRLKPYTIICTMRERTKISASLIERLPNLKLITTTGPINRSIDLAATEAKGIPVSGTTGIGDPTLEHIWALILSVVRHIVDEDRNVKTAKPQWQSLIPTGLSGKTLCLLGVGRLGSKVARIAKLFGMRAVAWSPHLTKERADAAGVEFAPTKEDLFKQADILSIHLVLSPTTRHLVTAAELGLLKPTAFFINTSRGPIVEEAALLETLSSGKIAGAGLDVYDIEPLPLDHSLRKLANVTLSPHNAYISDDQYKLWWSQTVENVVNFLDGKPSRALKD